MKKLDFVIWLSFSSVRRLFLWIGLLCVSLSFGGLLCIAGSPRGMDLQALKIFIGFPFCCIFIPVLLISISYKIKICNDKIIFNIFFQPVKMILLNEIEQVSFTKIASNGQPCAITVSHKNGKYIYPVRLFNKTAIERLINELFKKKPEISHKKSKTGY